MARLFRIASSGVADYMWSRFAPKYPELAPLEIGARRFAREEGNFSYKNCVVAEQAMQASEEVGNRTRSETAQSGGGTVAGVDRYEVALFEVSS